MPMRVNETWHQHPPLCRNDADIIIRVDGDWARGYALNGVALTNTLEGDESAALLPSKMRTF
jgi:hypothetical protein